MRGIAFSIFLYTAALALAHSASAQEQIAPQITAPVTLNDRIFRGQVDAAGIEDALDFAVTTLETDRPPPGAYVSSCRLWADAIRGGYEPFGDTRSIWRETEFERACLPFLWLQRAHASRVSYLPVPARWPLDVSAITTGSLEDWPWGNETRTRTEANPEPPFQHEPSSDDPVSTGFTRTEFDEEMGREFPGGYGWQTTWWEVARGDLNGDGIEDALILIVNSGIGNTSAGSTEVVVTRRSRRGPIEVLADRPDVLPALVAR